jgi:hypothetical protein
VRTLAHVTTTPEAAVFRSNGDVLREVYRGRIDDRYLSIGQERPQPQQHDLEAAISAALAGKPVPQSPLAHPSAVPSSRCRSNEENSFHFGGCGISCLHIVKKPPTRIYRLQREPHAFTGDHRRFAQRWKDDSTPAPVIADLEHDVASVLYKNCATCHHPGGAGPFSLLTYADARRWGPQLMTVTQSRFMPPWLPEPGYGDFADVRRLSDHERDLIKQWVDCKDAARRSRRRTCSASLRRLTG